MMNEKLRKQLEAAIEATRKVQDELERTPEVSELQLNDDVDEAEALLNSAYSDLFPG